MEAAQFIELALAGLAGAGAAIGFAALAAARKHRRPEPPSHPSRTSEIRETRLLNAETAMALPGLIAWREAPGIGVCWASDGYFDALGPGTPAGDADNRLFPSTHSGGRSPRRSTSRDGQRYAIWSRGIGSDTIHAALPISAFEAAEDAARAARTDLGAVLEALDAGHAHFDPSGRLLSAGPAFRDIAGELRVSLEAADAPGSLDRIVADFRRSTVGSGLDRCHSIPKSDGGTLLVMRRPDERVALLNTCVEALDLSLLVFDGAGKCLYVSPSAEKMFPVRNGNRDALSLIRSLIALSEPGPAPGDIRDFILGQSDRIAWSCELTLRSGERLLGQCIPLARGRSLIAFHDPRYEAEKPFNEDLQTA